MTEQFSPTEIIYHKCKGGKIYIQDCYQCGLPYDLKGYVYIGCGNPESIGWIKLEDYINELNFDKK